MNEQRVGLSLRHTEYIRGYLLHIYCGTGTKIMVVTQKLSK